MEKNIGLVLAILLVLAASSAAMTMAVEPSDCAGGACVQVGGGPEVMQASSPIMGTEYYAEIHGDYVAAGTSLRNEPWDLITITGVPGGATVVKAILVWNILEDSVSSGAVLVNGTLFEGTVIKTVSNPYCWSPSLSTTFAADVTGFVTGNGVYMISGYPTGVSDFSDPWSDSTPPLAEGASLIVVYENPSEPLRAVVVDLGNEAADADHLISWASPAAGPVSAKNTWIVIDGQDNAANDVALFNGVAVAGPGSSLRAADAFPGADPRTGASSYGALWDTLTVDVSGLVAEGDTSASAGITASSDCIGFAGNVFSVTIGPGGAVGGQLVPAGQGGLSMLGVAALAAASVLVVAARLRR